MRFQIPTVVALLGSVAAAAPTSNSNGSVPPPFNDGRGATIYKGQSWSGDGFAIPGNSSYCTNLNNVFSDYDGKVRSFRVEARYQCEFFLGYGCLAYGQSITYGNRTESVGVAKLSPAYDYNIHSIYCCAIYGS
ncbi:hypothetical protein GMOD_00000176 [Pyrenophora seminiperda CCB06]|uniref:Uncharacterized protein n=1 Tax=Pyrenophora seminiperda CCB06 TaxID=1302712 RepID=A0A3M7M6K3_9PLEO|nr:hypothetical protein GMOD_00000176 [Pyrenophora seminiperda CCB06]